MNNDEQGAPLDPAFQMIEEGNIVGLTSLLDNGLNVDLEDGDDETLLCYAARSNNIEIATLLIARGANVNGVNEANRPITYAIYEHGQHDGNYQDNSAVIQLLIARGANVTLHDFASARINYGQPNQTPEQQQINAQILRSLAAHPNLAREAEVNREMRRLNIAASPNIVSKSLERLDGRGRDGGR